MKSKNKISCLLQRRSNWCFCLSEEAGSDTRKKTTAIDKGDHYLLNGTKKLQNGSSLLRTLSLQTDIEKGHKGINAFIVEKVGLDLILVQKKRKWEYVDLIHTLLSMM
jgi:alkylation response protein AidB-like acyl-CoA dehydrogenase